MRNLKRALSLALASVMLLGMMVVGTSAASYPDVDENDNVEAIEVLNAVKVMIGDRGNFRPDAAVNRHEMAVIMAKLVLGNETADNYVGSHPFTDVFPWADKYVAACYENGLVSGTSATTFSGNQPLTAVQAAAMMLRALGYKDLSKGASDWRAPVTAMANQIRLFNGVASNPSEQLDRNQVAQLALNTLKSPVVDLKDGTFDISSGDGQVIITGGSREYIVRSSRESYAQAINRTEYAGTSASQVSGYTIELGEHLYNGKLRLEDTTDDFGRPARQWEYDGKAIGAYAKDELLRKEYTAKVTGKDLYDLLGKTTIDEYDFYITVDGETEKTVLEKGDNSYFTEGRFVRTNTNAIGATDKGVLTQVFVDSGEKDVYISVINTYLAKATKDYDTKNEKATFEVYGVQNLQPSSSSVITLVKNTQDKDTVKSGTQPYTEKLDVRNEDINVENVKEDDIFLVNVADGEIKVMSNPEVKSEATITAFKKDSWVNSDGQIDYADTALYDPEVLEAWDNKNMKNLTYNIFQDKYGYLIGLEQNSDPDQYVFITGRQAGDNDLGDANADMRAIFLDGTVKVIEVNLKDSKMTSKGAITNTWCTYTENKDGSYTLKEVANRLDAANKVKVAQWAQNANGAAGSAYTIDKSHVSFLTSTNGTTVGGRAYGNDDTVYLGVSLRVISNASLMEDKTSTANSVNMADKYFTTTGDDTKYAAIIDEVDSVTVGAKNISLKAKDVVHADVVDDVTVTDKVAIPVHEIYTLYKDNGYAIAAVVIGEDEGANSNYAYITGKDYSSERYDSENDEWTWTLEAVVNGKVTDLTYVGSTIKYLDDMAKHTGEWFEVRYDADGRVRGIKGNGGTDGCVAFAAANDTANDVGKFIGEVIDVELSVQDEDTALMKEDFVTRPVASLTYKNGTLYTNKAATEGFSVSPSVKTVLCLTSASGKAFNDVIDDYDGYSGLEDALDDLNSDPKSFKGYLNVLFDDGVATVIILDDRTPASADPGTDTPSSGSGTYTSAEEATGATPVADMDMSKAYIDDTMNLKVPALYMGKNVRDQLEEILANMGYKVTKTVYASSTYTFTVEKDGKTMDVNCAPASDITNAYYLLDNNGTKTFEKVGTTPSAITRTAPTTPDGTGWAYSVDGGAKWKYGAAYGSSGSVGAIASDVIVRDEYVNVTGNSDANSTAAKAKTAFVVGPKTSSGTADNGTGFSYATTKYVAYSGTIPADDVTGNITLTPNQVKVTYSGFETAADNKTVPADYNASTIAVPAAGTNTGTGAKLTNGTSSSVAYAAYGASDVTVVGGNDVTIEAGYVKVSGFVAAATGTAGTGASAATAAITGGAPACAKVGSKLEIKVTTTATAGATTGTTVTITATGATAPAAQDITKTQAVAGTTLTFELTVGSTNITAIGCTIAANSDTN